MDQTTMDKLLKIDEFHTHLEPQGETGTGLGLIICNEFIPGMEGKFRLKAKLEKAVPLAFPFG